MKVTDLMIGDWVLFNDNLNKIRSLTDDNGCTLSNKLHSAMTYELKPVPLTPEILEKNFGKPYPRGGFHNYRMEKDETIAFVIEDRRVSAAPDNRVVFCRVPGTYICDVNYVHELQHALKLCGIEKEIEL